MIAIIPLLIETTPYLKLIKHCIGLPIRNDTLTEASEKPQIGSQVAPNNRVPTLPNSTGTLHTLIQPPHHR